MKFDIITITDRAADRIKEIISSDENVLGIRISIKNAGCVGVSYVVEKVYEVNENDDHIRSHNVDIYIDKKATLYLLGTEMDYEVKKLSSGFVFNNPNQTDECGCGLSVQLKKADLEKLALDKS